MQDGSFKASIFLRINEIVCLSVWGRVLVQYHQGFLFVFFKLGITLRIDSPEYNSSTVIIIYEIDDLP